MMFNMNQLVQNPGRASQGGVEDGAGANGGSNSKSATKGSNIFAGKVRKQQNNLSPEQRNSNNKNSKGAAGSND